MRGFACRGVLLVRAKGSGLPWLGWGDGARLGWRIVRDGDIVTKTAHVTRKSAPKKAGEGRGRDHDEAIHQPATSPVKVDFERDNHIVLTAIESKFFNMSSKKEEKPEAKEKEEAKLALEALEGELSCRSERMDRWISLFSLITIHCTSLFCISVE